MKAVLVFVIIVVIGKVQSVTGKGPGLEQVCLGPASSAWALDFMQEIFHNTSPGDFESTFIKAGDSEMKEGLRIEEAIEESIGGALL